MNDPPTRPKLISCRVMIDELRPFLPAGIETEVFDISLHTHPQKLRERLQAAVDASDGIYDPIWLGYGMCAKAVVGLVARRSHLVVAKANDCIELFLGSRQARLQEIAREPGTYFLTKGYIGDRASMVLSDYDQTVARYGKEKTEKLLDMMMRHYRRLVYIRMPGVTGIEEDRFYARRMAARFGLKYVELDGTMSWLSRLPCESHGGDFIVVEPGQPIETRHFLPSAAAARV